MEPDYIILFGTVFALLFSMIKKITYIKNIQGFSQSVLTKAVAALVCIVLLIGCSNSEPNSDPDPFPDWDKPTQEVERTLLIYSVAANNLIDDLRKDTVEMVAAGPNIAGLGKTNRVLLYFAPRTGVATLSELTTASGKSQFKVLKNYSKDMTSVDPARIRQVWEDVRYYRPARNYDMILESHGTGWKPDFNTHGSSTPRSVDNDFPVYYSFGSDQSNGFTDSIDIDELVTAFDDGQLGFLWFDACFMAGIETEYQFRKKADYFIGYVTEIWGEGLAYDQILPYLVQPEPDLIGAATSMFEGFNSRNYPASISITDMSKLPTLAAATRPLVSLEELPYALWIQNYERFNLGPFYDFGQYVSLSAETLQASEADIASFNDALNSAVVFKRITTKSFPTQPDFDTTVYSGLNTHIPGLSTSSSKTEEYWRRLDWAIDVY